MGNPLLKIFSTNVAATSPRGNTLNFQSMSQLRPRGGISCKFLSDNVSDKSTQDTGGTLCKKLCHPM